MSSIAHPGQRQAGIAAVEFAVILPLLLILLAFPIFFGRVFMHYSVIEKAAHDAALYYSTIPLVEMNDQGRSLEAKKVAETMVEAELAELNPGDGRTPVVVVLCDNGACGNAKPKEITVNIRLTMFDDYFNDFTWVAVGADGLAFDARVTVPYLGN